MSFIREINPGRFNKKIEIHGYVEVENKLGQKRTVLVKKASVWAEMKPKRGTEFLEYYRDANSLQYVATTRYKKSITVSEKDVLVYDGKQFEINAVIDINEAHVYLEIYCTESKDKVVPHE